MTEKFWVVVVIIAGFLIATVAVAAIVGWVLVMIFAGDVFLSFIEIISTMIAHIPVWSIGVVVHGIGMYLNIQVYVSWRRLQGFVRKLVYKSKGHKHGENAKNSDTFKGNRSSKSK